MNYKDHYIGFPIHIAFDTEKRRAFFGKGYSVDMSLHVFDMSRLADEDCPVACLGMRFDRSTGELLSEHGGVNTLSPTAARLFDRASVKDCIIHAEENMIMGCGMSWPERRIDAAIVYGLPPCLRCAARLKESGVSYVLWIPSRRKEVLAEKLPRWEDSLNASVRLFEACGIAFEFIPDGQETPEKMRLLTPPYAGII